MGARFLKIAVIYFLIGVFMGMFMSMTQQFQFAPSHAHINLLGWVSLALAGVIYVLFPKAGESRLGKWHFWLHNLGLPVMMIGLVVLESGNPTVEPVIVIGANILTVGIILFVINVLLNVKASEISISTAKKDKFTA
ncbi:cytochrome-c oxidase [Brevibacillus sp. SYSU BS000544]|uniref:cytochrome-c oxidase n=1 Tax=Brevibacillus sp. SYSU BS000544 TaxID=3416443 RepID=UPI003CE5AD50